MCEGSTLAYEKKTKSKRKEIAPPSRVCSEGGVLLPFVCHSLSFVVPSFVVPCHCSFRRLSFPAVCRSPLIVIPRHCSFPIVRRSRCWSFPLIRHPLSSSSSSTPPYLPTSSGSQAGWGCCVTWDWRRLAVVVTGERARCYPASRGSQQQRRGVSFGGWGCRSQDART
jgi:hypothetical protein